MILDRILDWSEHITTLKSKAKRALNLLKILSKLHYGPDKPSLQRIYWAVCRSKTDYGAQLYSAAKPRLLEILDSIHNDATRLCSGAFRTSPVTSLLVNAEEVPLELHRQELCLRYIFRIQSNKSYAALNFNDNSNDLEYWADDRLKKPPGVIGRHLINTTDIDINPTQTEVIGFPPWKLENIEICTEGSQAGKKNLSTQALQQKFRAHLHKHSTSVYCFTDGSKTADGVGYAAVFETTTIKGPLPKQASIFTAELTAIEAGLDEIKKCQ